MMMIMTIRGSVRKERKRCAGIIWVLHIWSTFGGGGRRWHFKIKSRAFDLHGSEAKYFFTVSQNYESEIAVLSK